MNEFRISHIHSLVCSSLYVHIVFLFPKHSIFRHLYSIYRHLHVYYVLFNFRPHSWRDNITTRKGAGKGGRSAAVPNPPLPAPPKLTEVDESTEVTHAKPSAARKVSVVIQQKFRRLVNPNKKEQGNASEVSLPEVDPYRPETPAASRAGVQAIDHGVITNQFKYV